METPSKEASEQPRLVPTELPIRVEVLRSVLDYLAERPYREVAHIISAIQVEINRAAEQGKYPSPPAEK